MLPEGEQERPIAIVTGAYRGLGLETARQLAELGHTIILTARRGPEGVAAAGWLAAQGLAARFHPLDVTDESSVQSLVAHIRDTGGRLDVLVNNAGIFPDPPPGSGRDSVFDAELAPFAAAWRRTPLARCGSARS